MRRATPWTIQSVHPDMQDAARSAALREGLALRQWIQQAIEAHAANKGLDTDELDSDERDEAIADRLALQSGVEPTRLFAVDTASTVAGPGANKVDGMLKDLAARLRDGARSPASTPRIQASAQSRLTQHSALRDALQEALRAARPEQEPTEALQHVSTRTAPSSFRESTALRQQIGQLARSVADLPRRQMQERENLDRRAAADEFALRKLTAKTDEIRELLSSVIARPAQSHRLERQLDALGARIDAIAASTPSAAQCNELSRGLGEIRSLLSHGKNPDLLATLDQKLDQLSRKMETMAGRDDSPKFDDLARRIDSVRDKVETDLTPKTDTFQRMIEDLKHKLNEPAPKVEIPTLDFSPMEREIRRLSEKIDAAGAGVENLAIESLRGDVANLSARVDAVSATVHSSSALATQTNAQSLESLRKDINALCSRIEGIASTAPEVAVLDVLQSQMGALVNRIEALPARNPPGVHALEALIIKLADKIDAMAGPSREETMLAQLHTEIGRLAQRLETAPDETVAPALAMLEQVQFHLSQQRMAPASANPLDKSISDMFQQIQALREAAVDVAETGERHALHEAILAKAPPHFANEALQRELSDLRAQQQSADQRTAQTLNAVHETLNRLVSRLNDLEDDLCEVRPEPVFTPPSLKRQKQEQAPEVQPDAHNETPRMNAPRLDLKPQPVSGPAKEPVMPRVRELGPSAVLSNQASFIAAARRAAHAAENEAPEPARPKALPRIELTSITPNDLDQQKEPGKEGALSAIRRVISARRRPMLIALAGLLAILGSLQTLRTLNEEQAQNSARQAASPASAPTAQAALVPQPEAAEPVAPVAPEASVTLTSPLTLPTPGFAPPLSANSFGALTRSAPPQPVSLADAAANGQADAQYELGVRLADGRGLTQDSQAAQQWLDKAAKQNLAPAQYRLAAMLERGIGGAKDLKRAQDLYGKAAAQGHVRAMHNMGVLSAEGLDGKPDYAVAASWFRKAADFGLRDSQFNLAILFARGMGVEKNLPAAYAWFNAAAAQNDVDSAQKRDEIAVRLTATQMASAKAMVEAFKARIPDPAINEVTQPAGGWDTLTVSSITPKPAAPAPKARVSKL